MDTEGHRRITYEDEAGTRTYVIHTATRPLVRLRVVRTAPRERREDDLEPVCLFDGDVPPASVDDKIAEVIRRDSASPPAISYTGMARAIRPAPPPHPSDFMTFPDAEWRDREMTMAYDAARRLTMQRNEQEDDGA